MNGTHEAVLSEGDWRPNDFNRQLFLRLVISSSGHFLFVAINSLESERAAKMEHATEELQVKVVHCKYECLSGTRCGQQDQ